ncbi:MAG TPA: DNA repair protein RadA [Candidatus Limnocylindrales bacterium]|nr:DNA repair protein RadA [Candidatus Limnocylindrales bacterium]
MARSQSRFVCQACGAEFLRWEGQCRSCAEWNTLVETVVTARPRNATAGPRALVGVMSPVPLSAPAEGPTERLRTSLGELDRVLGGGIVPGSLLLIGGEPGVGKSTLLLQVAGGVATADAGVLYATGEESAAQVRLRAGRLGLTNGVAGDAVQVLATSEVGAIVEAATAARPALVVVDSIQTMTVEELDGPAGSVGQVKESALRLMELAKGEGVAVVLVGHVTKDGSIAGPRTLEHLVDAVIELGGERGGVMRLLRASKNRFGSTDELGVLEMREEGLREVDDPGRAFLAEHLGGAPGSVVAATMEGSRPLLVEVQALVSQAGYSTPARRASGIDPTRLALLLAVLGRRAGIGLGGHDVYANLAGGLSVAEPGLDLAVALALASSLRDRPIDPATVAVGEVGLLGELRPVAGVDRRLREAARLGFQRAVVPAARDGLTPDVPGLRVVAAANLRDAISATLAAAPLPGDRRRAADAPEGADSGTPVTVDA